MMLRWGYSYFTAAIEAKTKGNYVVFPEFCDKEKMNSGLEFQSLHIK